MARVKKNPAGASISGNIGDLNFYQRRGEDFVRPKGERDPKLPWSDKQLVKQSGFREAVAYAKAVNKDPAQKAKYQGPASAKRSDAFHQAVSDAMQPPVVLQIAAVGYTGLAGQSIIVRAQDNFEVAKVIVAIADTAGGTLEEGPANLVSKESGEWVYTTRTATPASLAGVILRVTVADRPQNEVVAEIDHLLRR